MGQLHLTHVAVEVRAAFLFPRVPQIWELKTSPRKKTKPKLPHIGRKAPWPRYTTRIMQNKKKWLCFRRVWVKESRRPETISEDTCYLYGSMRLHGNTQNRF